VSGPARIDYSVSNIFVGYIVALRSYAAYFRVDFRNLMLRVVQPLYFREISLCGVNSPPKNSKSPRLFCLNHSGSLKYTSSTVVLWIRSGERRSQALRPGEQNVIDLFRLFPNSFQTILAASFSVAKSSVRSAASIVPTPSSPSPLADAFAEPTIAAVGLKNTFA